MKLTIDNYFDQVGQYLDIINADSDLLSTHNFVIKVTKNGADLSKYQASEAIAETIDLYLDKLVKLKAKDKPAKKQSGKSTPAAKKTPVPPKQAATVKKKAAVSKPPKTSEPETESTPVEHIPSDIALVKRYVSLHDKDKTYDQVLAIWRAFNKAIVERKVSKDSPYKSEIATMNSSLKSALDQARSVGSLHLVIPAAKLKAYKSIAESVAKSTGVAILMEFINISGKAGMKERADKLGKRIIRAMDAGKLTGDRYLKDVKKAQAEIESYMNSETEVVNINDYALNGIGEIAVFGCACDKELSGFTRSQNAIIYKLILEKVKNLQDGELDRAFSDTIAPGLCKTIAQKLIHSRMLTMSLLRNPAKVSGGNQVLSGSGTNRYKAYDFGTEIMDMRLRNAGSGAKEYTPTGKPNKRHGLSGIAEAPVPPEVTEDLKIMSASELVNQKFRTMGLQGKYRKLIGDPEPGFSAMIYGKPKQGKSTVAIDMAKEFTRYGKVLYCAFEEGHGYTLQDKVIRNKANVPGLDFANKLPPNLSMYQFVFVDSVSDAGLDEVAFKGLIKANKPHTSILGIFHATKGGNFRGGQTYAHDVDVLIKVDSGVAEAQGRFAPPNQINIQTLTNSPDKIAA